jgi:SAM-dependent methyltransferase
MMHASSFRHMRRLIDRYLDTSRPLEAVEIGSRDVNGSYRELFQWPDWTYRGCDQEAGPNVDLVQDDPYRLPLPSASLDLAISGQTLEHAEFFWLLVQEIARVVRPGGHVFLIAPSRGPEHRHPVDCWRFLPDGFRALARYARLELLEVHTDWAPAPEPDSAAWGDTVGVFRKPLAAEEGIGRLVIDLEAGTLETSPRGHGGGEARRIDLASDEAGRELGAILARILWERRG